MNNSTVLSPEQQSLKDLNSQFLLNIIVFDALAPLTILSNFMVTFILVRGGKSFRSNYYMLLIHTTLVAIIQASNSFVLNGIIRIAKTVANTPDNGTVLNCTLSQLISELTVIADQYNILVLAVDRVLAITIPFRYKKLSSSKVYVPCIIVCVWLISIVITGSKFILFTKAFAGNTLSVCVISNTRPPAYATFRLYHGYVVAGATVLFYSSAIIVVKVKIALSANSRQLKKEIGFRLMVSSATDGLVFTATYFVSQAYLNLIASRMAASQKIMLTPLAFGFILLSSTPRFIVIYLTNKDLKGAVKKSMGATVSIITTVTRTTMVTVQEATTKA